MNRHPAARAAGVVFHEGFRTWTLFPIDVQGRRLGHLASVDGLALYQLEKLMNAGRWKIYYQDSAGFADQTGADGAGGDM
ncbi:MAG: hypothetical protein ACE5JS_19990 [Nitrospinota bacterium]